MKKSSKRMTPVQILVMLVILAAVAFLRNQGYGSSPSQSEPNEGISLPQIQVDLSPTKIPAKPTKTPRPQINPSPTATNLKETVALDHLSEFDYFVLTLSWSPDYCATNGSSDPQQCSIGKKLGFVLHGLWPQYQKGYPSNCSTDKMPQSVKDQFPGLYPNDNLFAHEWEKHGTCTGLTPLEYLQLGQELIRLVFIPNQFRSPEKTFRISSVALKTLFREANPGFDSATLEVSCSSSGRYLKEIYVCFSREGRPTSCSAEMQKTALKSCQAADFLVRNIR